MSQFSWPRRIAVAASLALSFTWCAAAEPARGPAADPPEAVLLDFEPGGLSPTDSAADWQAVGEHATQGKRAGKAVLTQGAGLKFGFERGRNLAGRWGQFDRLVIDVFVEGGPVRGSLYVKDEKAVDWASRYNFSFILPPGKRKIDLPLGGFVRRDRSPLDLARLTYVSFTFTSEKADAPATMYLDYARLVKGTGSFESKALFAFAGNDRGRYVLEDWPEEFKGKSRLTVVDRDKGGKALRLESAAPAGNVQFLGFEPDWSSYDALVLDVTNPSDQPVHVSGWVRSGDLAAPYDARHNWDRVLRPGPNTLRLPLGGMALPKGGGTVDPAKIVSFNLTVDRKAVVIDGIRLTRGIEEIAVPGMRKFDFGPPGSAVMPGFTAVSKETAYSKDACGGWLPDGTFWKDFDIMALLGRHRPPDDLCRDFCCPVKASFAVDLPNGRYRAWLMMAPPKANIWSTPFHHRTVKAQGKAVLDEEYDAAKYKAYEFHFQDAEDLPGDDLWDKYIPWFFKPRVFDVNVADGRLVLDFDSYGESWAAMVNALVVYPAEQEEQARKWFANLDILRKEQYNALHVESLPTAPAPYKGVTDSDRQRGYVRFVHSPDRGVQVNSVPSAAEAAAAAVELFASPGEWQDGCVALYPLKDCGTMKAEVSDLQGPDGATIPASSATLRVARYKALNHEAVYSISPHYLDLLPADGLDLRDGITRSFWLIVHVPDDAKGGTYRGRLKLSFASGKADSVEVVLTVWPIRLAEVGFPMGIFMMSPQAGYATFDRDTYWKEWKDLLEDARAHGMTSLDPGISIPLKGISGGKADVNFDDADKFMELAKAAGFHQELMGYATQIGVKLRAEGGEHPEGPGGPEAFTQTVKAYFDAVREHARQKQWLPISFCADDEYLVHPGGTPEKLGRFYHLLQGAAPGFRFNAVDTIEPDSHPDRIGAYEKMLPEIDTWGAGIHSPKVAEMVKKAGRRLWLYNTGMDRFTFGTYMFFARKKWGVEGFFQWIYNGGGTYGTTYLASHRESFFGMVSPSSRGLRPTLTWERIRAGCNDHRYLETAWKLIEESSKSGKGQAQAQALQKVIDAVLNRLTFGNPKADALAGERQAADPMDPARLDALRKSLAEGIMALQQALRQ